MKQNEVIKWNTESMRAFAKMYNAIIHGDFVVDGLLHWDIEFKSMHAACSFAEVVALSASEQHPVEPLMADLWAGAVISSIYDPVTLTVAQIDPKLW